MPTESSSSGLQFAQLPPGSPDDLEPLLEKVVRVHGDHNPRLREVAAAFAALKGAGDRAALDAELARLRDASEGFSTPPWGCRSYRHLMARLAALETDLRLAAAP